MSVFTPVSPEQAAAYVAHYTLGEVESLEGIAQGVENTNYFLETTTGHYVLTLFEKIPREDLPFYVNLMHHLAERGVRCPAPMPLDEGGYLGELNGRPACIVTRLPGAPRMHPSMDDCRRAGEVLATIHEEALDYDAGLANWRGREWRERFAARLAPKLAAAENALIESENRYQGLHDDTVLPRGVIHGDYFRDNVLWDDEGEPGVIDFYFACDDALLYDVAIAVNDWCQDGRHALDPERAGAFLAGYDRLRPLTDLERELWPVMLRRAALRTWLGRLEYEHFPAAAEMTIPKDHDGSRRLLESHIATARPLEAELG